MACSRSRDRSVIPCDRAHRVFVFFSTQVAIKIIDKTQLNPNSLQKVTHVLLRLMLGQINPYKSTRRSRSAVNGANGKQSMLGRR